MSVYFGEQEPTPTTELPGFNPAAFWQPEEHETVTDIPDIDFSSFTQLIAQAELDESDRRSMQNLPRYYGILRSYFSDTTIITDRFGLDHQTRRDHLSTLYLEADKPTLEGVSFRYWQENLANSQLRHNVLTRLSFGTELIAHSIRPLINIRPDKEAALAEIESAREQVVSQAQMIIHNHYATQTDQINDTRELNERGALFAQRLADLISSLDRT